MHRRFLLRAGAAGLALPMLAARAQAPGRTVRILVGFGPGSGPDIAARLVAQQLQEALRTSFVVENRLGAGGNIAAQEFSRAPADGSVLLLGETGQVAIAPAAYRKLGFDPGTFVPIVEMARLDLTFVVSPRLAATSVDEFVRWARREAQVNYATPGAGSTSHFLGVQFNQVAGTRMEMIHHRSPADVISGLASGQLHATVGTTAFVLPHVREGRMRALATTGPERTVALAQVPTFGEVGMPRMQLSPWLGFFAPAGTPPAALQGVEAELPRVLRLPDVRTRLEGAGMAPTGRPAAEFRRTIVEDTQRWGEIVRTSGFKANAD